MQEHIDGIGLAHLDKMLSELSLRGATVPAQSCSAF